ncbi:MAG: DcaP family trimeric outer membrane transporter, partial [Candidatus Wenzhouxiangella sp. M2_3B_020]
FIGPTSGTTFGRTPMVRYTSGGFAIALENPESSVTPLGGGRIETDENELPELAARYTWKGDWGHFQVGGLLRQLGIDNNAAGLDDEEIGWGLSASGKFMLGRDDIRYMLFGGEGLGRHVALNFANGAALTDTGSLTAIESYGGFVAYRHWWNQKWRSNVTFAFIDADNPTQFTGFDVNQSSWNAQVNLFYSPVPPLSFGVEWLTAERELESGAEGQLNRFQFTTKYSF